MHLARDHGRDDMGEALREAAGRGRREELRGLAAAALWDVAAGVESDFAARTREQMPAIVDDLLGSRLIANVAWGALIRAASKGGVGLEPLLTETLFRWVQWGWLE
jgi:hypothetical protein